MMGLGAISFEKRFIWGLGPFNLKSALVERGTKQFFVACGKIVPNCSLCLILNCQLPVNLEKPKYMDVDMVGLKTICKLVFYMALATMSLLQGKDYLTKYTEKRTTIGTSFEKQSQLKLPSITACFDPPFKTNKTFESLLPNDFFMYDFNAQTNVTFNNNTNESLLWHWSELTYQLANDSLELTWDYVIVQLGFNPKVNVTLYAIPQLKGGICYTFTHEGICKFEFWVLGFFPRSVAECSGV
jgi:hypothetical protein